MAVIAPFSASVLEFGPGSQLTTIVSSASTGRRPAARKFRRYVPHHDDILELPIAGFPVTCPAHRDPVVLSIVAGPAATAATADTAATAATADMAGRREEGQQQQSSVDNGGGNNCQVTANDGDWSIPPGRN